MLDVLTNDRTDFDAVFLEIRMVPNVADGLRQNALLLGIFAAVCVAVGALFWLVGAGPVMGFMGLELILLYAAYRFGYTHARRREWITLSGRELRVRRWDHRGHEVDETFEPYWSKLEMVHVRGRVPRLFVSARGHKAEIGAFLGPEERLRVADALHAALADVKP